MAATRILTVNTTAYTENNYNVIHHIEITNITYLRVIKRKVDRTTKPLSSLTNSRLMKYKETNNKYDICNETNHTTILQAVGSTSLHRLVDLGLVDWTWLGQTNFVWPYAAAGRTVHGLS